MGEEVAGSVETRGPAWHVPKWEIDSDYPFPPGHVRRCSVCDVREGWPSWHRTSSAHLPTAEDQGDGSGVGA